MTDRDDFDEEFEDRKPNKNLVEKDIVENLDETPLMPQEAGKGKTNSIAYIKVTREDGASGERGYKGRLPSDATIEMLARRYGNGIYRLDGCNYKHRVLLTHSDVEVSVPEFDDSK